MRLQRFLTHLALAALLAQSFSAQAFQAQSFQAQAFQAQAFQARSVASASPPPDLDTASLSRTPSPLGIQAVARTPAPKPLTARWLDLKTLSFSQRYRNAFDDHSVHVFDDGQQRSLVEGRLKLDSAGRYAIGFRASSGRYFNWAYADYAGRGFDGRLTAIVAGLSPAQLQAFALAGPTDPQGVHTLTIIQSHGWQFYPRELYLSATPLDALTVEFGSFGFERGLSTEITTFDEDGYLSGERLRVRSPRLFYFDEIGFTSAFFGDIARPSFIDRGESLQQSNYRQLFARKQLNPGLGFSGDYTWQVGTHSLREAAVFAIPRLKPAGRLRIELYQRLNTLVLPGAPISPIGPIPPLPVKGAAGFAAALESHLGQRLRGDFGFASIDKDYDIYVGSRAFHSVGFSLNGDAYSMGKRVFLHGSWKINPSVTAFGFYTHAVGPRVNNLNQQGLNAGLTFDLKALVNSEKQVF